MKHEMIEIQGRLFPIESEAHKILSKYLQSVRRHFSQYETPEVVTDIESRIAEKFATEILTKTHKVVTVKDVNLLISEMGTIEDIAGDDSEAIATPTKTETRKISKRLYRNPDEAMLGGVASGIASYLNIDPLIIRFIFIATVWMGGYSILLYIILWILVPAAKTPAEKLQMRGDSFTLSSLEQTVVEGLHKVPTQMDKVRSSFVRTSSPFIEIISTAVKLGLKALGFFVMLGAVSGITVIGFGLLTFLLNPNYPYVDPAFYEIAGVISGAWMPTLLASIFMVTALPLIVAFILGLSLFRLKWKLNTWIVIPLFTFWLFAMGTLSTMAIKFAPAIESKTEEIVRRREVDGNNQQIEKNFELVNFDQLEVSDHTRVTLHQGPFQIKAIGHRSAVEQLQIVQKEQTLSIGYSRQENTGNNEMRTPCWIGCDDGNAEVEVWVPDLKQLTVSDIGRVNANEPLLTTSPLVIQLNDNARVRLEVNVSELNVNQTDVSRSEISGLAKNLLVDLSGASRAEIITKDGEIAEVITRDVSHLLLNSVASASAKTYDASRVEYLGGRESIEVEKHDVSEVEFQNGEEDQEEEFETR